jgi:hypothetical protein
MSNFMAGFSIGLGTGLTILLLVKYFMEQRALRDRTSLWDRTRTWDKGEHHGCGIDSQRAYERQTHTDLTK